MTSQTPDIHFVLERIEKLERRNRGLKGACLLTLTSVGVLVLMGQARPSRTVEANELILKDDAGTVRARLHMDHGGPMLSFYDADQVKRIELGQLMNGVALSFRNNPRKHLGDLQVLLTEDGPYLHFVGSTPESGLAMLSVTAPGPQFYIMGKDRKLLWKVP